MLFFIGTRRLLQMRLFFLPLSALSYLRLNLLHGLEKFNVLFLPLSELSCLRLNFLHVLEKING